MSVGNTGRKSRRIASSMIPEEMWFPMVRLWSACACGCASNIACALSSCCTVGGWNRSNVCGVLSTLSFRFLVIVALRCCVVVLMETLARLRLPFEVIRLVVAGVAPWLQCLHPSFRPKDNCRSFSHCVVRWFSVSVVSMSMIPRRPWGRDFGDVRPPQ